MTKLHIHSDGESVNIDIADAEDPERVWCLPVSPAEARVIAWHLSMSAMLAEVGLTSEQFAKLKLMGTTGGTA